MPPLSPRTTDRYKTWGRLVGARLVALVAVGLLVLLALADVRSFVRLPAGRRTMPAQTRADTPAGPGWPHRRGPRYDGTSSETALANRWPAEGPLLLWSQPCGRAYSGIAVVAGRLFTQTQSLTAQEVECRDTDSGQIVWRHRYGWPYEPAGMYPGPRATPTWHAGRLYFAGPDGEVGCLNAADGRRIWLINVNERFGGRGTEFGYSCSPLVERGKVILPVGGKGAAMVALNADDGSTVWASGDQPASYCSALPIALRGRRCAVAFLQNALGLFDLETGTPLGLQAYSSGYDEHSADPLYREPFLVAASPFRAGAACYRLDSSGPAESPDAALSVRFAPVWSNRRFSNDTASSVLLDGRIYGFDLRDAQAKAQRPARGTYKCLDFATGEVLWETDRVGHATAVAADGKLFLFTDAGELILARAESKRFEELGRTQVFQGEICWTAPALDQGRLYLRSPTQLACIYVGRMEDLAPGWREKARPASSGPVSRRFDLAWLVGGEREYAMDPADAAELRRWYAWSMLGVLVPAAAVAWALGRAVAAFRPGVGPHSQQAAFWAAAILLGIVGTPIFNRWAGAFVFTWPVCLFVAHQVALHAVVAANRTAPKARIHWRALAAVLLFIATCLAYYLACRRLGLATEWAFLVGFLPSWPLAVPAAYRLTQRVGPLQALAWVAGAFSLYFWSVGALLLWQAARV